MTATAQPTSTDRTDSVLINTRRIQRRCTLTKCGLCTPTAATPIWWTDCKEYLSWGHTNCNEIKFRHKPDLSGGILQTVLLSL